MVQFSRLSIKQKLVLMIMVVSSLAVLLAGISVFFYDYFSRRESLYEHLQALAEMLGSNCTAALSFNDSDDAEEVLKALQAIAPIGLACVYREDGSLFAVYKRPDMLDAEVPAMSVNEGYAFDNGWLILNKGITLNHQRIGMVTLQSDLRELTEFTRRGLAVLILAVLAVSLLAYLLASKLQSVISTPITHLSSTAKAVWQQKDYSVRAVKQSDDEFGLLIDAFNEMLSEIQRRDLAIRENEERYRGLTESTSDWVWELDKNLIYTYSSPRCRDLLGFEPEEIIGKTPFDLMLPEEAKRVRSQFDEIRRSARVFEQLQIINIHKDGHHVVLETSGVPIFDTAGFFCGYRGIDRDITDRHRIEAEKNKLEEQLYQSQKMETVGTLAGGIAHDFNNLLMAISGYAELALFDKNEDLPEFRYLQEIVRAAKRGGELTQQLLTFSRKVESKLRPIDLSKEIKKVCGILERTIEKMIEVNFELSPSLPIINADSGQIEQVLINLAINARDAMPEGGSLSIETQAVRLNKRFCEEHMSAIPGDYVQLSVKDTGSGMESEVLEHIFEPFYTTKGVSKGTGLGLSIVYGIIKNHGGFVLCHSIPGEGTTFDIYFPVVEKIFQYWRSEKSDNVYKRGTETILLIEDELAIRNLGEELLSKLGYKVLTASNGEMGIEIYRDWQEEINLVILDLIMPGIGGEKCLDTLLKINPEIKVIAASGYYSDLSVEHITKRGFSGYLRKPYDPRDMLKMIREILDIT